ncbi:16984_t:CDS:2 [Entrophospora sp. SA101]|nr:16984_t:CDS:2 [Entrophospora sp. SA101]
MSSSMLKVAFSVVGIYSCFLTWGVLQERVSTTPYGVIDNTPQKFKYFIFLNTIQSFMASFVAFIYLLITNQKIKMTESKLYLKLMQLSFFGTIGSPFGYESLKHIDYPTLILGKSCKLLPVMLMNVLLYRRKYPLYKYFVVFLITIGVSCFMLLQPVSEKKKSAAPSSLYGIMLLSTNLIIDGITNSSQDQIFNKYKISGQQMMFYMNFFSGILMLLWMGFLPGNNELINALNFCQLYPEVLYDILLFSLCGALGQCFIFFILRDLGSLFLVTITVTRKLFTIILSIFWFNHKLSLGQWLSVALVFIGIGLEAYIKQYDQIKINKMDKKLYGGKQL